MANALYRLPLLDESLEDIVEHGGDICSLSPLMTRKIPLKGENKSYGINLLSEFYMKCLKEVPIAAVRSGAVITCDLTQERSTDFHETNFVLIDHHDGTYAKYTHVFPEIEKGTEIKGGERLGMLGRYNAEYGPHLHLEILEKRWGIFPPWKILRPIMLCPTNFYE